MSSSKTLVFHVQDKSVLSEGTLRVIQGEENSLWKPFECTVLITTETLESYLSHATKCWQEVFPDDPLLGLEIEENNSHLVVRASTRSPLKSFKKGGRGVRSWMFLPEEQS